MSSAQQRLEAGPEPHDRFAHLRAQLATFREVTAHAASIAWCVSCEVHHAPHPGGLCPVCADFQGDAAA